MKKAMNVISYEMAPIKFWRFPNKVPQKFFTKGVIPVKEFAGRKNYSDKETHKLII